MAGALDADMAGMDIPFHCIKYEWQERREASRICFPIIFERVRHWRMMKWNSLKPHRSHGKFWNFFLMRTMRICNGRWQKIPDKGTLFPGAVESVNCGLDGLGQANVAAFG